MKMNSNIYSVFFLSWLFFVNGKITFSQTRHTISGYVKDSSNGESMIGANVYVKENLKGTTTNDYGFFSLTLEEGTYTLIASYLGFEKKEISVVLNKDVRINFQIVSGAILTKEVVITGERADKNVQSTEIGKVDLPMEKIKSLPVLFGEVDVLKTLQLLPGVSATEGNTGLYIRGGGPDQNLILLDEAPVYNTGHLFGFFSVFNSDAIKNTTLIKGGMPANYGGRISSVIDISMLDGNDKKYTAVGGIGTISSRLTVSGPLPVIRKDSSQKILKRIKRGERGSFIVSGRRTYIDVLIQPFLNKGMKGNRYFFYDLNAKANYRFSDKDRIFISGYFGKDILKYKSSTGRFNVRMPWGNATTTLRWNHLFTDKLFMNATLIYTNYNFDITLGQSLWSFRLYSGIKDYSSKWDFDYFPSILHHVKFGLQYTYHIFTPNTASAKAETEGIDIKSTLPKKHAHDIALYALDEFDINDRIKLNAGVRLPMFIQTGPYSTFHLDENFNIQDTIRSYKKNEIVKTYTGVEPRLSLRYLFNSKASIKAGWTINNQYIHLVSSSTTTLPTDLWVPSSLSVKPQIGTQYSLGYFRNFKNNAYETSIEVYYKEMKNQIEFRDGFSYELDRDNELDFAFGKGYAYGIELFFKKSYGKFNGWAGYTLSWSNRHFETLFDKDFPARYDQRHNISVVASYKLSKRWSFSATFVYSTGFRFTFPLDLYYIEGMFLTDYQERNSLKVKNYHRADISANWNFIKARRIKSNLSISVYNVYNRKNTFAMFYEAEGDLQKEGSKIKVKAIYIFPILPSLTWNFEL